MDGKGVFWGAGEYFRLVDGWSILGSWMGGCVSNRYVLSINCWYFGGIRSCRSKEL